MPKARWLSCLPLAGCCALAFCIPFPFQYATICIWLLALCWLAGGNYRDTLRRFGRSIPSWLWVAYFALHAAAYFYSIDKDQSLFDTVGKLSYILLPFLIGAGYRYSLRGMAAILGSFIAGLTIVLGICLWNAYGYWREEHLLSHFFYHELPRGFDANAVYMAWYACGALAALLLFPWREAGFRWVVWARWIVVLFLSGVLLLLASRLALVFYLLLIIPAFGLQLFRRYRLWLAVPLLAIGIGLGGLYVLGRTQNPIHKRFTDVMHPDLSTVTKEDYAGDEPHWTNLTLRLFVWRMALENMELHHLWWRGTGNGDAHTYQNARIMSHGIPYLEEHSPQRSTLYKVNLHNMYLQSLLMFGLPGFVIFLVLAVGPMFRLRAMGAAAWAFALFHLSAILFFLQESALQTQAGVIYYCFFSALFWAGVKGGEKTPSLHIPKT